ncbi:MAG TPA: AAA family ATPase [Acidimicrobiia bacterium]|nr:AAA family ATPase [Acidimicrobiia bacterium]
MPGGLTQEIVLVSGAPGSGKTALAIPLAQRLGFSLIVKDDIKETIFSALGGVAGEIAESRRYGRAAMEVLWTLMRRCPQVVLDSNFRPEFAVPQLTGLDASIVEVHCSCAPDELVQRITNRASVRHAAHWDIEWLARFPDGDAVLAAHGPVGIGSLVSVDTTTAVDIDALASSVEALLHSARRV